MISLILPYYDNPAMLQRQQQEWATYPEDIEILVVDDCSPNYPAADVLTHPTAKLFRLKLDVRWNWIACRNIGAQQAAGPWLLLTDIDHIVSRETLDECRQAKPGFTYNFERVQAPHRSPVNVHCNSWLIEKRRFWEIGGYDERFSGWYGSDHCFRLRVTAAGKALRIKSPLVRYGRSVVPDANTRAYDRKTPADRENVGRIKKERAALGDWKPLTHTFRWERLR